MLKHFAQLSTKIQETSKSNLLPWESRWIAHLLIKDLILENPKLNEMIDEYSNDKNFPQAKLRALRNEIRKDRTPSVAKTIKGNK